MNSFLKFKKIVKNDKIPIKGESIRDPDTLRPFNEINTQLYNIAIPAKENNLIILDIDYKDDGLIEWKKYTREHTEPYTVTEKTPNGGLHYYFIHKDPTYTEEQNKLIDQLKQKNKYRNKGIDLKINGGYAVCEPSTIDNKGYQFIRHYNKYKFEKIPLNLLKWLLEFELNDMIAIKNNICLVPDMRALSNVYERVVNHLEMTSKIWFLMTTATKNLLNEYNDLEEEEVKTFWDEWSQIVPGYNKVNNYKIWDVIKGDINFNYLLKLAGWENDRLLDNVKPYKQLYETYDQIKKLTMCNKYVYDTKYKGEQINPEIFNNYNTIIIKSTTGTGKTTATAKLIKQAQQNGQYKIMSIINLISLVAQHQTSFNKEGIQMKSYQDEDINLEDDNIIICINSILKYSKYEPSFFNNYIVYADEVTSLLNGITHNHTLNDKLKGVYITLMKIINNCHKLILSDATINDNVFYLVQKRADDKKIFIENTFKKYEGIWAHHYKNENWFLKEMIKKVKNNEYFLFGCDSMEIAHNYHDEAAKYTHKDNLILKTSKSNFIITNADEQFKNKFVFYSPSITTGIDISYNIPQDVFIYMKGMTISPLCSFQQLTRTRNIKNVYFYLDTHTGKKQAKYNSLEDTKEHFKKVAATFSNLSELCFNIIDDELIFNENSFFKLFTYNEYTEDIFETNKAAHFKQILKNNGFKLSSLGGDDKLDKKKKIKMKKETELKNEKVFEEHINEVNKNETLTKLFNFLSVVDKTTATQYKDILIDKHKTEDYLNLTRLLKKREIINNKLKKDKENLTDYKAIYTNYYKVSLIWQLEDELKINRFNFNYLDEDKPFNINEDLIKKINIAFRTDRNKHTPKTYNDYIHFYVQKIKQMVGDIYIIESKKIQINKVRRYIYKLKQDKLNEYLKLYELSDPSREYLIKCEYFYKQTTNQKQITEPEFIDTLEENNRVFTCLKCKYVTVCKCKAPIEQLYNIGIKYICITCTTCDKCNVKKKLNAMLKKIIAMQKK